MSESIKRELNTPIVVICYGKITADNQRLFAISDPAGHYILPLFTDFEQAEEFRKYHNDDMLAQTLSINITGVKLGADSEDTMPEQLMTYVVDKPENLNDILSLVHIAVRMAYITINPRPGQQMLCYELDELSISGSSESSNTA